MKRSNILGAVILGLFALPFCGFGLAAVFSGLQRIAGGESSAWVLAMIGAVFASIGFGLLVAAILGPGKAQQTERLRAEHASDPWVLRADWAQGRSDSKTRTKMISAWTFTILWSLVSSVPIFVFVSRQQYVQNPKLLFVLLFPAASVGLFTLAIRETVRWFEFGKTYFQMSSVPFVIGRECHGTITARFPHIPEQGVRLKLSCVNRFVSGSGKDESTSEKILWRDDAIVPVTQLYPGPTGTTIPVSFRIPLDMPQTDSADRRNTILWVIEADASVPGVDYKDVFEVPVFRTKDTPSQAEPETENHFGAAPPATRESTIRVRPSGDGTEFYFPAGRNKGFAATVTLFACLFTAVSFGLFHYHVVFIFPLIFGFFSLLLVYITLLMWFGTSTVLIGLSSLRVRSGLFGGGRWAEISFGEISEIQTAIAAQQGGSTGTPYYDIQLIRTNGRKVTLGSTVRNKHEAEWLVSEMKRLTGLNPSKAVAAASGR